MQEKILMVICFTITAVFLGYLLGFVNAGAKKFWLTPILEMGYATGIYFLLPYWDVRGMIQWILCGSLTASALAMMMGWCMGRSRWNHKKALKRVKEQAKQENLKYEQNIEEE